MRRWFTVLCVLLVAAGFGTGCAENNHDHRCCERHAEKKADVDIDVPYARVRVNIPDDDDDDVEVDVDVDD